MTCPKCGHENPPDARVCGVCGSALAAEAEQSEASEPVPSAATTVTCPACGTDNVPEARFCSSCGTALAPEAAAQAAVPPAVTETRLGAIPRRDLGGLLTETFAIYRGNFWPFVIIALVPQVPSLVTAIVPGLGSVAAQVILGIAGLFLSVLAGAATVWAVGQQAVDRPVDVVECYRRAWYRVLSLVIAFVLVFLALLGSGILSLIIIGIPLFFYLLVNWFYANEAIMFEGNGPIAALGRSRELVRGTWWRVFGIGTAYVFILLGLLIPGLIAAAILGFESVTLEGIAVAVIAALVTPIFLIGRTLVYFDLRVRKEGYTLDTLAAEMGR